MRKPPLILVSADVQSRGKEFHDLSTSLSNRYPEVLLQCGALPLILPSTTAPGLVAEAVRLSHGVLLTGGDDIDPRIHRPRTSPALRAKACPAPDGGARDLRELLVLAEVFAQKKPLLAICRGHQLLNVALGGTLYVDLPLEFGHEIDHAQLEFRNDVVHEARLTPDSMLAKITSRQTIGVNSTHHQAVRKVAEPLVVSARSADGLAEGLELKPGVSECPFLVSVQFHPERLADRHPEHRAIFEAFVAACVWSGRL